MSRVNPFRGLGIALVTPFKTNGEIDFERLESLIESQINNNADFICILGTTAETPCLATAEKQSVIETAVRINAGRIPLLLGVGTNCTETVANYLRHENLQGIDGVLVVTPYYNKPTQEGLYRHFKAIAQASSLPIVLYNVPGRTGVNLTANTTLRIANECPNVVAVKEASGNVSQIDTIINSAPQGFEVLSGDDAITYELLTLGATGVISVVGNAYPAEFGTMVHEAIAGNHDHALQIHRKFSKIYPLLTADGNPSGIKALLSIQGRCANQMRLPLVCVSDNTYNEIADFVETFKG